MSPLPYAAFMEPLCKRSVHSKAKYDAAIAEFGCDRRAREESAVTGEIDVDDAEFIVRACNSHEKLVEALERALGIFHPNSGPWSRAEKERSWAAWETQARAAIAEGTE